MVGRLCVYFGSPRQTGRMPSRICTGVRNARLEDVGDNNAYYHGSRNGRDAKAVVQGIYDAFCWVAA
jgi:hypothetical protein